jgi:glycosyltransferase involved in cell wall biosynthesis
MTMKKKLIRTSTIALSLDVLLKGQLHFLKEHFEVIAVSGKDHHLTTVENREGVRTVSVAMQREISLIKDLVSLVKLYLLFKKEKPFIVHSITPKAGLLSMIAAYFAGVPVRMHTFTGLIFPSKEGMMKQLLILMDQLLCRFATHIYPEGQGVKKDLLAFNITKKPLTIIAKGNVNGIDTTYYTKESIEEKKIAALKTTLNITEEDFVFIYVGRLVGDKGINELGAAFSNMTTYYSNAKLLLVGPQEPDLDPLDAATLAIIKNNKNIIATGYQNDVRPYFSLANALVFPSYREGFPNVVLQAGAMGLPSIVTNINGCNEIIEDQVNGLIIPVKDTLALETAMKRLMEDTSGYRKMQQNARPLIVSRYEQQVVWEAILAEYKRIENKSKG